MPFADDNDAVRIFMVALERVVAWYRGAHRSFISHIIKNTPASMYNPEEAESEEVVLDDGSRIRSGYLNKKGSGKYLTLWSRRWLALMWQCVCTSNLYALSILATTSGSPFVMTFYSIPRAAKMTRPRLRPIFDYVW